MRTFSGIWKRESVRISRFDEGCLPNYENLSARARRWRRSRENSFVIIDDAGVEIGQGGLEYRVIKKMLPDRPLDIEMTMNAHPMASDTLFGALSCQSRADQG